MGETFTPKTPPPLNYFGKTTTETPALTRINLFTLTTPNLLILENNVMVKLLKLGTFKKCKAYFSLYMQTFSYT